MRSAGAVLGEDEEPVAIECSSSCTLLVSLLSLATMPSTVALPTRAAVAAECEDSGGVSSWSKLPFSKDLSSLDSGVGERRLQSSSLHQE